MSDHPVTIENGAIAGIDGLLDLVTRTIRAPNSVALSGDGLSAVYHFNVDLTAAQTSRFADLVAIAHAHVRLDIGEYDGIKADIQTLVAFQGISSPTLAQTAAATKAQTRILRAMLRS